MNAKKESAQRVRKFLFNCLWFAGRPTTDIVAKYG